MKFEYLKCFSKISYKMLAKDEKAYRKNDGNSSGIFPLSINGGGGNMFIMSVLSHQ